MPVASKRPGDQKKLRELILYIAEVSEGDAPFGAVKLNKLLFYSDFLAYLYLDKPITGCLYQALPTGPAPNNISEILSNMVKAKDLAIREQEHYKRVQNRPLALRSPRLEKFTAEEIAFVDQLVKQYWGMNATEMREKSHDFVDWHTLDIGETIPYSLSLIGHRQVLTEQEKQWAADLEPLAQEILSRHTR